MLFNSYEFLFLFLPVVVISYYAVAHNLGHKVSVIWLVIVSLFFYGWWNPVYIGLIIFSMLFNFGVGVVLSKERVSRKFIFAIGVACNLALLGYYKYANFFVDTLNFVSGSMIVLEQIVLPLAISFFTFQQIAYLADSYSRKTKEYDFLEYALFVTFFPQLIAGPIVHHKEMMPQFGIKPSLHKNAKKIEMGLVIYSVGLFKKVVIADSLGVFSTTVFSAAAKDHAFSFIDAWVGSLSYTFQLYFDFSAYSDMAIGIGLMLGISLPVNFNSPYKARNIIDFWRRWHMTLSRFLKDYLYIPLGGNRHGQIRRYINLLATMLLGGLWHGAGWTFVLWGLLHGLYIVINHAWHAVYRLIGFKRDNASWVGRALSWLITFLAVVIAWVFFRAESVDDGFEMFMTMFGVNGIVMQSVLFEGGQLKDVLQWIFASLGIVLLVPNTLEWVRYEGISKQNELNMFSSVRTVFNWLDKYQGIRTFLSAILFIIAVLNMTRISEFLYFQF